MSWSFWLVSSFKVDCFQFFHDQNNLLTSVTYWALKSGVSYTIIVSCVEALRTSGGNTWEVSSKWFETLAHDVRFYSK